MAKAKKTRTVIGRKTYDDYFAPVQNTVSGTGIFPSNNEFGFPTLLTDLQVRLPIPVPTKVWNADPRDKECPEGLWIHYTADTKIMTLFGDPFQTIDSLCSAIVELNVSLDNDWLIGYGLTPLIRKRHYSRVMQEAGISILVDLCVPSKFRYINLLGIPDGWGAYATRGASADTTEDGELDQTYASACHRAGTTYCLDDEAFQKLRKEYGLPVAVTKLLRPMKGDVFETVAQYEKAVKSRIGLGMLRLLREPLRNYGKVPGYPHLFFVYGGGARVSNWVKNHNSEVNPPNCVWLPEAADARKGKGELITP